MSRSIRVFMIFAAVLFVGMLLSVCGRKKLAQTGSLVVNVAVPGQWIASAKFVAELKVQRMAIPKPTAPVQDKRMDFPIVDRVGTGRMDGLTGRPTRVTVEVKDPQGTIFYSGSQIVEIIAGETAETEIKVSPVNQRVTAVFSVSSDSGDTQTPFTFDASGSSDTHDDTSELQVRWDWENDGTWDTEYSTDKTAAYTYATAGQKTVRLEAKDSGGKASTFIGRVHVFLPLAIKTAILKGGWVGAVYSDTLLAAGGLVPYRWSIVEDLPSGLGLDAAKGIISGRPMEKEKAGFTVKVMDSRGGGLTIGKDMAINIEGKWLKSIKILPSSATITLGRTHPFQATGRYTDDRTEDVTDQVVWRSTNVTVATIDAAGLATSKSEGTTQIEASLSGVTSPPVPLTVVPPALKRIDITPSSVKIAPGRTQQFVAMGIYSDGRGDITTNVRWWSSNPGVATISSAGLAVSRGEGTTDITASMLGKISSIVRLMVTGKELGSISTRSPGPSTASAIHWFRSTRIDLKGSLEFKNFTSFRVWRPPTGSETFLTSKDSQKALRFRDELALQLELERRFSKGSIFVATKLLGDQGDSKGRDHLDISDHLDTVLREAYLDLYLPNLDLRLGKQIFSWGRTDLINPTDNLTPVDFTDILDTEKFGLLALKADGFIGDFTLTGVWIPTFSKSLLPVKGSRFFVDPLSSIPAHVQVPNPQAPTFPPLTLSVTPNFQKEEPSSKTLSDRVKNAQYGLKISGFHRGWDFSTSYFYGFRTLPTMELAQGQPDVASMSLPMHIRSAFLRQHVVGVDFATTLGKLSLRGEGALYIPEDSPILTSSDSTYALLAIGGERGWRIGAAQQISTILQYIRGIPTLQASGLNRVLQNRVLQNTVVGILRYEPTSRTKFNLLGAYNVKDRDSAVHLQLSFKPTDSLSVIGGVDLFQGGEDTFLGTFSEDDRSFLKLKVLF